MTTQVAAASAPDRVRLGFGRILRSEWLKLRTLRSTWWCAGLLLGLSLAFGVLLGLAVNPENARLPVSAQESIDVQVATLSVTFTQLVAAVLGVLVISGEYGTGMIRSTFAAVPRRLPAVLAKLLVLVVATFVLGIVAIALTALAAAPLLALHGIALRLVPEVWLPMLGGALFLALIAALAFAIGTLLRNSAGGIATVLGLLLVVPVIVNIATALTRATWLQNVATVLPSSAGAQLYSYADSNGVAQGQDGLLALNGWSALAVLILWVVVLLVPALVLVRRRDT